jgi:hypothetical protein
MFFASRFNLDLAFLTAQQRWAKVNVKYYLDTLSRVVEGSALRSHSNRFQWNAGAKSHPRLRGEDKVRS